MMNILERLKKIMPKHVQPITTNRDEYFAVVEKISREASQKTVELNRQNRLKYLIGRSGISPLHQDCRFENYQAYTADQRAALHQAIAFAKNFGSGFGGFVFSGSCGTGKNHLAAAIGHCLINKGKSVLCITVADLMMRFRSTYEKHAEWSEEALLRELCNVDLLVLDEIGIQHRNSDNTQILINQLVDRRTSHKKPIGMLTNLTGEQISGVLGERVLDRMMMDNGIWVNFNWESYRSKVKCHA